jgi:hypothetical protein
MNEAMDTDGSTRRTRILVLQSARRSRLRRFRSGYSSLRGHEGWVVACGQRHIESVATPEAKDLDQARRSVQRAIEALRRQEQSLSVRWRHANEKATPEQIAQHQAEVMLRIVEHRQAVERDCDEYEPPQAG